MTVAADCTYTSATAESLSLDDLRMLLDALRDEQKWSDPLAEWMREQGFDPARGALLVLPLGGKYRREEWMPRYVRFSSLVREPLLMGGTLL